MVQVKCNNCREDVEVSMYYHDTRVVAQAMFPSDVKEYVAYTRGKAICPMCGHEIHKEFKESLSTKDIIELAIRKEKLV